MSKTLKFGIIMMVILCVVLLAMTIFDFPFIKNAFRSSTETEELPAAELSEQSQEIAAAVKTALLEAGGRWADYQYEVDHIQVQEDGLQAIVWLAALDLETGELVGREPELAIAKKGDGSEWEILLEDNEKFLETFKTLDFASKSIEGDLISEDEEQPKSTRVFGGYYLPWAKGLEKRLTWSVGHTSCYPIYYCTHAFDFADGTMFPLVAAKGGTVYHWKDTCANGDSSCTNSITLQDRSTTPWTYQIYLHIAQNSIPSKLKHVGTPVMQGQYIADVDDTGYSTGHHVHFMVVAEETHYTSVSGYVWGVAEDITYRDVSINWDAATQGGRPRLAYEAATYGGVGQTYYVSGNKPANPPTGALTAPAAMTYANSSTLNAAGWGEDDIAVTKIELLANYNGSWVKFGNDITANPFNTNIDLCSTSVPDGLFYLGMRVWDYEGNPSGILGVRRLIKDADCTADPNVSLNLGGDVMALPSNGLVSASVTKGSSGAAISSVEFWLREPGWAADEWVNLGKDTNGANGWQAPINISEMAEGSGYAVMAVVTDSLGHQDADVNFNAVVDHTPPVVNLNPVGSPVLSSIINLEWTASDNLSGLASFSLAVSINGAGFQTVESGLSSSARSYLVSLDENTNYSFTLTGYDNAGNTTTSNITFYTAGYAFTEEYIFPLFFNDY